MTDDTVATITKGYTFSEATIERGVLMADGNPVPDAKIRIPLGMLNRHGPIAGATGVIEEVAQSSVFKQVVRWAGREIVRGIFGTALRK